MTLQFQPVQVATGSDDADSMLVFDNGLLVAVLVHLSEAHEVDAGYWFLEVGFGRVDHPRPPTFLDLDEAGAWITRQLYSSTV